jgi:hypothetical protein
MGKVTDWTGCYRDGWSGVIVPEGLPCQCGAVVAHWDVCLKCGHETMKAVGK